MKIAINYMKAHIEELKFQRRNTLKTHKELVQLYTDSINSMTKAIEHLKEAGGKCKWIDINILYKTSCGEISDDFDNDFKFCPYCGREIEEAGK